MKKWIAMLLVFALALSLCACGAKIDEETQAKLDLYDKYEDIIEKLEDKKYEKAVEKIYDLYLKDQEDNEDDDDNGDSDDDDDTPATSLPVEPTQEEYDQLWNYARLLSKLDNYVKGSGIYYDVYDENGDWVEQINGNAALGKILEELKILTVVVDKWANTDYINNVMYDGNPVNWNSREIMGKFTALENVLLRQFSTTTDNMGNVNTDNWGPRWYYNVDGTLNYKTDTYNIVEQYESNPMDFNNTPFYFYDANGRLEQIKYGYYDNDTLKVSTLVINTYDDAGKLINQHVKTNDGECDITYTYDANGRLYQIDSPTNVNSKYRRTYTYTYDANGNLVKEEKENHYYYDYYKTEITDYKYITEYTYDANGILTGGTYTEQRWSYDSDGEYNSSTGQWEYTVEQYVYTQKQDQHTYTCDASGNILTKTIVYGDTIYMHGDNAGQVYDTPSYESSVIELVYGNYYFYDGK